MYTPDRSAIVCSDLYILSSRTHQSGQRIEVTQAPKYFQAIEHSGTMAIEDVQRDSRTSELAEHYLAVEGINSMMDVGIRLRGELIGIVCHEHIGETREWSLEEQEFALSIANTVSIALEADKRQKAEEARKGLEQQILHAQKSESLGMLAGGIAHDFNNLLTSILGNADLALSNLPLDSPLQHELSAIEEASRHAAALCEQLLAYSGKSQTQLASVNLSSLVQDMVNILRVSISKKAILQCNFDDVSYIEADPTQLRQIIMNLVTNASEAIEETNGIITVTTGNVHCDWSDRSHLYGDETLTEGEYVFAEVADTGCGMDDETCSMIFDPFFTTKFTGRGLGLAATLGIIRGHHGVIKVKSAPGEGTTFTVFFPVARELPQPTKRIETSVVGTKWSGQGTILLVDDEKMIRTLTGRILKQIGFEVLLAEDGLKAVETFKEHADEIDCVMLDLIMPNMDGDTCFRELRTIKHNVRILLTSGFNEHEVSHRFQGKGQVGFIQKPYTLDTLRTKLEQVLDW